MKRSPELLKDFFKNSMELHNKMTEKTENGYEDVGEYDKEVETFFKKASSNPNLNREGMIKYFSDKINKTEMVTIKLRGWLNGYDNKVLKNHTSIELLNKDIILYENNTTYTVNELHQLYGIKQHITTLREWIFNAKLPPENTTNPKRYHRIDFERMLINDKRSFDDKQVKRIIQSNIDAQFNINN